MAAMGNSTVAAMTNRGTYHTIVAGMYWRKVLNRSLYV